MILLDSAATGGFGFLTDAISWIQTVPMLNAIISAAMAVAIAGGVLSLFVRR